MSRRIWLDRTIEAARAKQVTLPWARTPSSEAAPKAPAARVPKR